MSGSQEGFQCSLVSGLAFAYMGYRTKHRGEVRELGPPRRFRKNTLLLLAAAATLHGPRLARCVARQRQHRSPLAKHTRPRTGSFPKHGSEPSMANRYGVDEWSVSPPPSPPRRHGGGAFPSPRSAHESTHASSGRPSSGNQSPHPWRRAFQRRMHDVDKRSY
jgi:hypothetical protein